MPGNAKLQKAWDNNVEVLRKYIDTVPERCEKG